jgi:hypothetical protein
MPTRPARLIAIANRLGEVQAGSVEADRIIHRALGRVGQVLPYTREEAAARGLLPDGFKSETVPVYSDGAVYAACARSGTGADGLPHPHHGQWGRTLPLAMCGAALRARAKLARADRRAAARR